jgi:hypothetical protein
MLKATPNRTKAFTNLKSPSLILPLFLGGGIALLLPVIPAKAQEYDFRSQPDQRNNECYRVLVDDRYGLGYVKSIVQGAFLRGSDIQAGFFCEQRGVNERVQFLNSRGIYNVRVVRDSNGEVGFPPNRPFPVDCEGLGNYYVVVPALNRDLSDLLTNIRQTVGRRRCVAAREEPRGPHVRVGPFEEYSEAKRVNSALRDFGFRNARVYYEN